MRAYGLRSSSRPAAFVNFDFEGVFVPCCVPFSWLRGFLVGSGPASNVRRSASSTVIGCREGGLARARLAGRLPGIVESGTEPEAPVFTYLPLTYLMRYGVQCMTVPYHPVQLTAGVRRAMVARPSVVSGFRRVRGIVPMSDETKDAQPIRRGTKVEWNIPPHIQPVYARLVAAQADEHEITISFFDPRSPVLVGTPEEVRKQALTIETVRADCVARVVVAAERLPGIIQVLQTSLDNYYKLHQQTEEQAAERQTRE